MYFKEQRENKVFPGDIKAVVRPDPIPNSAVKRCVADGSACIACARVGRCRGFSLRSDEVSVTPSLLLFFSTHPTLSTSSLLRFCTRCALVYLFAIELTENWILS